MGFLGGSDGIESACNAGELGSTHESGRFPGEGNGNPLQYSCLENSMDRGALWTAVHGFANSQTHLSDLTPLVRLTLLDIKSCGKMQKQYFKGNVQS